jgi:hypothetical protein
VAAHGAAMTNALWMRRKTSVVEIFPLHYYVLMYREMCHSAGIYHFSWMDNIEVPEYDYYSNGKDRFKRWELRSRELHVPVKDILELVASAVSFAKGLRPILLP